MLYCIALRTLMLDVIGLSCCIVCVGFCLCKLIICRRVIIPALLECDLLCVLQILLGNS